MGAIEDLAAETERVIEETPGLESAPPAESVVREPRDYVVLLRADAPGQVREGVAGWDELGTVAGHNRAEALEAAEAAWPEALDGQPQLQLIPGRFWKEITPEEQPPPPPKRKWKGL